MAERFLKNKILIHCPSNKVFAYVTQLSLWHEWHPASESTTQNSQKPGVGQKFVEIASMKPIQWLPLTLRRQLNHTVTEYLPSKTFEVNTTGNLFNMRLRYELEELPAGTLFKRYVNYEFFGWLNLIEPVLLGPRMASQSNLALHNLKNILES